MKNCNEGRGLVFSRAASLAPPISLSLVCSCYWFSLSTFHHAVMQHKKPSPETEEMLLPFFYKLPGLKYFVITPENGLRQSSIVFWMTLRVQQVG